MQTPARSESKFRLTPWLAGQADLPGRHLPPAAPGGPGGFPGTRHMVTLAVLLAGGPTPQPCHGLLLSIFLKEPPHSQCACCVVNAHSSSIIGILASSQCSPLLSPEVFPGCKSAAIELSGVSASTTRRCAMRGEMCEGKQHQPQCSDQ